MAYLHDKGPTFIHQDLKPANITVDMKTLVEKNTYGSFHIKVIYHSQSHLTILEKEIKHFLTQFTSKVGEGI